MTADKVRENRLRRMAARQGYQLAKSRRRDPLAVDFGVYWIVDPNSNAIVAGDPSNGGGMDLDTVEKWLSEPESR